MEQNTIRSNRWNEAARYGLIFGGISSAYIYMDRLLVLLGLTGTFGSLLSFVLWTAKFVGCIKLMKYAMRKFSQDNPSAERSDIFRLGRNIAVLSALVFSTFAVADIMYISTEYYQAAYTTIINSIYMCFFTCFYRKTICIYIHTCKHYCSNFCWYIYV